MTSRPLRVVGITAGGALELGAGARQILASAPAVHGSPRHLRLVAPLLGASTATRPLPRPLLPALPDLAAQARAAGEVFVASGDPLFYGIGASLVRILGAEGVEVIPAVSSVALAAARLGWPLADTETINILTRPVSDIMPLATVRSRFFVLCPDARTPLAVAASLVEHGRGAARCVVLSDLGGPNEAIHDTDALTLAGMVTSPAPSDLCLVAVDTTAVSPAECPWGTQSRLPGLADAAYDTQSGQLTKQVPRAVAVSLLRPFPGALLWDVGGGAGSISIEWLRSTPRTHALCFESHPSRASTITTNARRLGVSHLEVRGAAPQAFAAVSATPDAVFIGGGLTTTGLLEQAWQRLAAGGRLVATAVTVEGEAQLHRFADHHPGTMFRMGIDHLEPLGNFSGWQPARSLVFYTADKPLVPHIASGGQHSAEGGVHTP